MSSARFHQASLAIYQLVIVFLTLAIPRCLLASQEADFKNVGVFEKLGSHLSREIPFVDENKKNVKIGDYLGKGKPIILNFVYYECPDICTFLLNGLSEALPKVPFRLGEDFNIVTVSINPKDTTDLAKAKKEAYLKQYKISAGVDDWPFLIGKDEEVRKLANEAGFGYQYNPEQKQYAHGSALIFLTSEGKIVRYLYGVQFRAKDIKQALLEVGEGKVGSFWDRLQSFFHRYDPITRQYSSFFDNPLNLMGLGTLVLLLLFVLLRL